MIQTVPTFLYLPSSHFVLSGATVEEWYVSVNAEIRCILLMFCIAVEIREEEGETTLTAL